jgi:hypothetical protein
LQHAIRPKLLGAVISDTIQHHTYIITLKIPETLNLFYASGSSYYYNIAKKSEMWPEVVREWEEENFKPSGTFPRNLDKSQ